ncbi:carboxypeptidase-like regulatory domain-containing protein [Chitinophaga rhizophila]|uniref:Carboxypeptidase-like regulatory domain-containing protein n=1 Tax=Chitinophaga rhizophila TaxID=2866212 RepID=A0ABS7GER9_9BACT|nr:carboxypeptidase-like regulatory domain-containing protein [Chitinophaga rhizophila]MBW8686171.1 carboxypeptidase-like regulatory domain-containing protein [Chitinophaga rhizophila]
MHLLRLSPVLLLCLLLLTISACRKELSYEGTPPEPEEPPAKTVTTSVQGRVLNEQRQPVQGATVSGGGVTVTTDVNGYFLLEKIAVLDDATLISARRNGYFTGYRTLMVREEKLQYVQLELLLQGQNLFTGSTGDVIAFPEGTLTFPANGVVTGGNQPYGGSVTSRSIYINPEGSTAADQMPGDLRGINSENRQVLLRAFSMIVFTLEDNAGAPLYVDSTRPATFRIMIPPALTSSAPQEIPLWNFDAGSGFWIQKGTARREGNDYIGTATKAGYWLCATTLPPVVLTAGIKDQHGNAIPNLRVTVLTKTDFIPAYAFTSEDGVYFGKVPANTALILTVTDNCDNVLRQQEIGPFTTSAQIDNVSVTLPASNSLVINGTAKDCDNFNVVTGKVLINVDGQNYAASISLGKFSTTIVRCENSAVNITLTGTDDRTDRTSTMTTNANNGTITPNIVICD